MKLCRKCRECKPESAFYDGRARCMACVIADAKARYWRNVDRYRAVALARWRAMKAER
jgi:hypothetical protein